MTNQSPKQYFTVPIPVEAFKLEEDNLDSVAKWCSGKRRGLSVQFPKIRDKAKPLANQDTQSYAIVGEYILKVKGGYVLMRAAEFEQRYKPATQRL